MLETRITDVGRETVRLADEQAVRIERRLADRISHPGITRTLSFYASHQVRYETGMFLYRVEDGRARFLGPYAKV
ncbi:hypothetical protein [Streptomyces sp. NPDC048473]|uniref:hypothetical protein n=1 Tax=unclassified Streptomyces TaxID=2593676 RepID=UPI0037119BF7